MVEKESILVQKFGGTSVGSADRIKAVADRVLDSKKKVHQLVVVVSAMGDTTNTLVKLAQEMSKHPDPREYDALVSTGENISASLLAMNLIEKGHKAISLTGAQAGVKTEHLHTKAKILNVDTHRIKKELNEGKIVIVTGFQGINHHEDITTIGRGGSDTSAVVLAAALNSETCEIYTDVDGIYTTDPRKVKTASKLTSISYDEMLELASLGAKVLHPRAVECAKENNITLHVRSSFDLVEGTRVKELKTMEGNKAVTGVTINEEEAIVSVLQIPDNPGIAGVLFTELGSKGVNVDMIIQSAENLDSNNISFTVMENDLEQAQKITEKTAKELGAASIRVTNKVAKISAVGVGMISKPGTAAKMFKALGDLNINILRISTSEIKISCIIPREKAKEALIALHNTFELNK